MRQKKNVSIEEYLNKGLYVIMRKCPTVHLMLGYKTIWELTTSQFNWIIENLSEEFKPIKK